MLDSCDEFNHSNECAVTLFFKQPPSITYLQLTVSTPLCLFLKFNYYIPQPSSKVRILLHTSRQSLNKSPETQMPQGIMTTPIFG